MHASAFTKLFTALYHWSRLVGRGERETICCLIQNMCSRKLILESYNHRGVWVGRETRQKKYLWTLENNSKMLSWTFVSWEKSEPSQAVDSAAPALALWFTTPIWADAPTLWREWILLRLLTEGSSSAAIGCLCRHWSDFWFKSCNAEENF